MNVLVFFRHSGEGRNLVVSATYWIPAFAGMTNLKLMGQQWASRKLLKPMDPGMRRNDGMAVIHPLCVPLCPLW